MDEAQGALDAARAAGAEAYAAEPFGEASSALDKSRKAAEAGDYRLALNWALDARERAQEAARAAADEKARARGEAERLLHATATVLATYDERLAEVDSLRLPAKTLAPARAEQARAQAAVDAARTAIANGAFREAAAGLEGIVDALAKAKSEIDAAAAARPARRPARR